MRRRRLSAHPNGPHLSGADAIPFDDESSRVAKASGRRPTPSHGFLGGSYPHKENSASRLVRMSDLTGHYQFASVLETAVSAGVKLCQK